VLFKGGMRLPYVNVVEGFCCTGGCLLVVENWKRPFTVLHCHVGEALLAVRKGEHT
jgi:hypothetical protein